MEDMFKYSLKAQNTFFKSNENFHTIFGEMRQKARDFQAKQAKYSPLVNYLKK